MKTKQIITFTIFATLPLTGISENADKPVTPSRYWHPTRSQWTFNENDNEREKWNRLTELAKRPLSREHGIGSDFYLVSAVEQLKDQELIAEIAKTNIYDWVRRTAVEKLTNQAVLFDIAKTHNDEITRAVAVTRLTNQVQIAEIAIMDDSQNVAWAVSETLTDPKILKIFAQAEARANAITHEEIFAHAKAQGADMAAREGLAMDSPEVNNYISRVIMSDRLRKDTYKQLVRVQLEQMQLEHTDPEQAQPAVIEPLAPETPVQEEEAAPEETAAATTRPSLRTKRSNPVGCGGSRFLRRLECG